MPAPLFLTAYLCLHLSGCARPKPVDVKEAAAPVPPPLLVADFTRGEKKLNVPDGSIGTWTLHGGDPGQSCEASLVEDLRVVRLPSALAVDYKIKTKLPDRGKAGVSFRVGHLDLRGYNHLVLDMRGDEKRGYPRDLIVQIRRNRPDRPEEMIGASWVLKGIKSRWTRYQVPLSVMTGISDWSDVTEIGLSFVDGLSSAREGRIYLAKISFEKIGNAPPWPGDDYKPGILKPSDELKGRARAEALAGRLRGFPRKTSVRKEFPGDSDLFLKELARDTWNFFEMFVDTASGLPLDTVELSSGSPMGPRTVIGDYTSVTNIGLYFMALPAAEDLGFISRAEAESRALKVLDTLSRMERHRGFFYNYYDTTTLERTTHFVSSVDSGWLLAGLVALRNGYSGQVAKKASRLIRGMDFGLFYDKTERILRHGFFTNVGAPSEYHYATFFTEARAAAFLAIGKGDIPRESWFAMDRVFPPDFDWQSQKPLDHARVGALGCDYYAGHYLWKGEPVVPSWGGSMFEALMPGLVIDEKRYSEKGWWLNGIRHVKAQIDLAGELGYPVWGMSPCMNPAGGYGEFGVKSLGIKGYPAGVVTPHASFLALPRMKDEAARNLRNLAALYPELYGECGFYDSVDPAGGSVAFKYLALDQGMCFLGAAEALSPGVLLERFDRDPIVKKASRLLLAENPLPR